MLRLYDTAKRAKVDFVPAVDGRVSMYVCGPTPYGPPHLGHGRKEVVFDTIRRYLMWRGFAVTYVSNVTDIEDKIIARASNVRNKNKLFVFAVDSRAAISKRFGELALFTCITQAMKSGFVPEIENFTFGGADNPFATDAMREVFGKETVFVRGGGSIPIVGDFVRELKTPTVMMGFGLPDDNLHAPNEKFHLANFYRGIESIVRFLGLVGG